MDRDASPSGAMKRGRPREFTGTPVSIRLSSELHDRLVREALRRDVELSKVIRERLSRESPSDRRV